MEKRSLTDSRPTVALVVSTSPQANASAPVATDLHTVVEHANEAAQKVAAEGPAQVREHSESGLIDVADGISALAQGNVGPGGEIEDSNGGDVLTQNLSDGDVRLSRVINSPNEDTTFEPTIEGASRISDLGKSGFIVFDKHGEPAAQTLHPWARDAAGNRIETHYEIEGTRVRKFVDVDEDTEYPVTADPTFRRWKFIIPEIYFNKEETGRARNPAVVAGRLSGMCAVAGPATAGIACGIGAAEAAGIAGVASNAYGDGKCMALRAGVVPATVDCD